MSDNVRYIKVTVTAFAEVPVKDADLLIWPSPVIVAGVHEFEKALGAPVVGTELKVMDEDFDPKELYAAWYEGRSDERG